MDKFKLAVINVLRELEVPAHLRGYEFIKSAMNSIHADSETIYHITMQLYPGIAKLHNTTPTRVERGIRHALTFAHMDLAVQFKVLGTSREMPNGEFLATLNESIKIQLASTI